MARVSRLDNVNASTSVQGDPLLARMAEGREVFQKTVLQPLKLAFKSFVDHREALASRPAMQITEDDLQRFEQTSSDLWGVYVQAEKYKKRLAGEAKRVAARCDKAKGKVKKEKSEARQRVGKNAAVSLVEWRADFTAARMALKEEGYTGSIKLDKAGPLYKKIQTIRQARALSASPAVVGHSREIPQEAASGRKRMRTKQRGRRS